VSTLTFQKRIFTALKTWYWQAFLYAFSAVFFILGEAHAYLEFYMADSDQLSDGLVLTVLTKETAWCISAHLLVAGLVFLSTSLINTYVRLAFVPVLCAFAFGLSQWGYLLDASDYSWQPGLVNNVINTVTGYYFFLSIPSIFIAIITGPAFWLCRKFVPLSP